MVMAGSSINSPVIGHVKNSTSRGVSCNGVPDEAREEEEEEKEGRAGGMVVVKRNARGGLPGADAVVTS